MINRVRGDARCSAAAGPSASSRGTSRSWRARPLRHANHQRWRRKALHPRIAALLHRITHRIERSDDDEQPQPTRHRTHLLNPCARAWSRSAGSRPSPRGSTVSAPRSIASWSSPPTERGRSFLRGGYGCGKTFMARLAVVDAQTRGFRHSFVVVSDNDLRFHRFDDVYRKVMTELGTALCTSRGARRHPRPLDRHDRGRADRRRRRRERRTTSTSRCESESSRTSPPRPAATPPRLRPGDPDDLIQAEGRDRRGWRADPWLCGSGNVGAASKRLAGIKGDIESRDALDYLRVAC